MTGLEESQYLTETDEKSISGGCRIGHMANIRLAGCPTPQRITTYSLSANRQRPFAGAGHAAIFNVFRRFRHQALYVIPPFVVAYAAMNWAIER